MHWWIGDADPHYSNNGNKLQISKCLFRVLLSLAQMQNLGPIYKTKNVYSLMFMLVIIQSICFEIISWHPSSWQKSWLSAGLIHRISFWLWARML